MKLILGNVDIPYSYDVKEIREKKRKVKQSRKAKARHKGSIYGAEGTAVTTGDVATWLENRYHPYRVFIEIHENEIGDAIVDSIEGAFETFLQSGKVPKSAFAAAESKIENRFREFITNKEMDALGYPGVPTKAALHGVDHRKKHPYKKRAPRPSFIDTGLYISTAAAEIEE